MDFKGFICILVLYISTNNGAALPEPEENYHYHFNQLAVVGHRTVQTAVQQPGHSVVARAAQLIVETRPITSTAIPAPPAPYAAIPPDPINVQNYNVDVPVAVPRAVPVPAPYKVNPIQEIVETPHIHQATVETHSSQLVVTTHATLVHAGEVEDNKEAL